MFPPPVAKRFPFWLGNVFPFQRETSPPPTGKPVSFILKNLFSRWKKIPFITGKYLSFPLGNIFLSYWVMFSFCNVKCFPIPRVFPSHWEMISFPFPQENREISPHAEGKLSPFQRGTFNLSGKCLSIQFPNWKCSGLLITYCTIVMFLLSSEKTLKYSWKFLLTGSASSSSTT